MAKSVTFKAAAAAAASRSSTPRVSSVGSEEVSNPDRMNVNVQLFRAIGFLEDLPDEDYVMCVDAIVRDHKHLVLENEVMTQFLKFYEPQMIDDISKVKAKILELDKESPLLPRILEQPAEPSTPIEVLFSDEGPRLNVSVRQDLLSRFLEEMDAALTQFSKQMKIEKSKCNAVIEEATISHEEIAEALNTFEETMINAVDPQTKRVPAEKFIWFLEEWLKAARQITEKFRLRNFSLKNAYRKCNEILEKKQDMGQTLHVVDFEQIEIQNEKLREQVENVNMHLQELKQFNGKANLALSTTKRHLQTLLAYANKINTAMSKCDKQIEILHGEAERSQKKLEEAKSAHAKVKDLITSCKAPDTLDYLRIKGQMFDLQKTKKILERKENLQHITLKANKHMIMQVTGEKRFKRKWLEKYTEGDVEDDVDLETGNEASAEDTSEFDIFKLINYSPAQREEAISTNVKRNYLKSRKVSVKSKASFKKIYSNINAN